MSDVAVPKEGRLRRSPMPVSAETDRWTDQPIRLDQCSRLPVSTCLLQCLHYTTLIDFFSVARNHAYELASKREVPPRHSRIADRSNSELGLQFAKSRIFPHLCLVVPSLSFSPSSIIPA